MPASAAHLGQCRLCSETKPLQDSHLVPKALYRRLRMPCRNNPDPVMITRQRAWTTSRQIKDYLLCRDCQQRFHRLGENWVLRHYDRGEGEFPLRKLLDGTQPVFQIRAVKLIPTAQISGVDMDKLAYFAVSVVWRAGVHRWRLEQHDVKPIDIRSDHQEQIRAYLVGSSVFPSDTFLWVSVAEKSHPDIAYFTPPYGGFDRDHYSFRFQIPGIHFALFIGPFVLPMIHQFCSVRSVDRLIHLTPNVDEPLWRTAAEFYKTCQPSASLRKP